MVTFVIDPNTVAFVERMLSELSQVKVVTATRQVEISTFLKASKHPCKQRFEYKVFLTCISMERYTYRQNLNCTISASRSDGVLLSSLPQDR